MSKRRGKSKQSSRIYSIFSSTLLMFLGLLLVTSGNSVSAMSSDQQTLYKEGINYFDESSSSSCSSGSAVSSLSGNDNAQKVWNFFKAEGLSDAQTAGIMGNLEQESNFNPTVVQSGGNSNDPSSVGHTGYGIAQWYGDDIESEAKDNNVSGPIYELLTQLNLVMAQMQGTSPTGVKDILSTIKTMSSATDVSTFFDSNFEGGTDPNGIREEHAEDILKTFGGTGSVSADSLGNCSQSGTVNCSSASGDTKILCEAEQWNGIYYYYGGGHESLSAFQKACPNLADPPNNQAHGLLSSDGMSGNPSPCAVDCSGLVDLATDMAFGVDMGGDSVGGIEKNSYWQKINFSNLKPGDIVTRTDEHVEIVDTFNSSSGTLVTFGAHETGEQDGTVPSTIGSWTGAYRYIGPGSSSASSNQ